MAAISLTQSGVAYTQNFDTLSNTAGSTTNTLTIPGWEMTETGGGARDNEQYGVDTGSSNTADTYSYGAAGATDRALGGLQSGTLIPVIGASFTNNTGATITSLQIAYTGEQWRIANTTAARDDRLDFQYSLNATSLATGIWTDVNELDFTNTIKTAAAAGALDGNAAANRAAVGHTITGLSIAPGATFYIRWNDLNASGADDGLAIDDFSLTAITGSALPTLSINDVTLAEGNAGTTTFAFTVALSAPAPAGGVTFDIATADGTGTIANGDYVANSLTGQTIPAGSSSYTFNVTVNGDVAFEPNETFFVNVANVVGATPGDGLGLGTITNDDASPPGVLTVGDVSVAEGDTGPTAGGFTVTRTGGSGGAVTANFTITLPGGIGGADGTDVTATLTGTVSFADGDSTPKTIPFTINGDRSVEPTETFTVALTTPTGGATIGGSGTATATITNDDVAGSVSIDVTSISIAEGTGGTTNAVVTLTRTGGGADFTVDYTTANGTATAGSDYTATSGTATFTGGANTATITIPITPDAAFEPNEDFTLTFSNPTSGATISGPATATVTIVDDDSGAAPGSVSIADAQIVEGNAGTSLLVLTLTRTGGTGAFTVDYATAANAATQFASATAGSDYAIANGTVVFGSGENSKTIEITINGDTTLELSERFRVLLSNATSGATISDAEAIATITNDDAPPTAVRIFAENFTGFTAAGFAPTPGAGQLDSDFWRVFGQSDAPTNPAYGFTGTTGDFARGLTFTASAGVYAASGDSAIIIQPTGAEFENNGFIEARVQNTTGAAASALNIAFDWTVRNNEARSSALTFSYSTDGTTFTVVPAASLTTPGAADALGFVRTPQSLNLTGLSLADQGYVYLRWTHTLSTGSNNRDEFGIDNVTVDTVGQTPTPVVAVGDVSVNENTGTMTFTVTRTNAVSGAFSVNYATADGTATAGTDYTSTSGTLSFAADQVSATVTVAIGADITPEFDETLFLNLSGATGAVIGDAQGLGTIVNDDGAPITIAIGDVSIVEGQAGTSIATFTVTRSGGTGAFDVNYTTANGTATAGSDYVTASGTLNFLAGQNSQTVSVTINGDTVSEPNETFLVNLSGATNDAVFADASATGTITNDDGQLISQIQGNSYFSPFVAAQGITTFNTPTTATVTVTAIVTVLDGVGQRQGFYITEETADWDVDNLTSEGIFVMTRNDAGVGSLLSSIPGLAVGDRVTITANVVEYQGFATSMPVTTLVNPVVVINSSGNTVPILTLDASRPIPNSIFTGVTPVYTDSVDDPGDSFDGVNYGLSFYETIEGMLVTIPGVVVADGFVQTSGGQPFFQAYSTVHANPEQINSRGGYTIAGDPALAPPDTANPNDGTRTDGRTANDGDINPDMFVVAFTDFAVPAPAGLATSASMGDQLGTLSGILNFDFSDIQLFVTAIDPASFVNTTPTIETTTLGSDSRALTIATFNVENLDPTDGAARFAAIANVIATNLNSPDILTIEEIQDNNGADASGGSDASLTWQMLVDAVNLATGKNYQWVDQAPVAGGEGGEPGGNIRVGFLYNTDRVQLGDLAANATLAERRQFTDRIGDGLRDAGDRILYSDNMIAGELNTADWSGTRLSLLGQFTFNGNSVFVTANHLPAKGGSGALWQFNQSLETGQPENAAWARRNAIAQDLYVLNALIDTASPGVGVVVAGDINDFYFYRPLTTLTGHTLADGTARVGGPRFDNLTVTKLTEAERYTYTFGGRSQAIDHVITNNLLNGVANYDIVHLNTGFNPTGTPALSDHDPALASFDYRSFGEILNGTNAAETILGFGGNDTIDGRGGADTLVGGTGNDIYIVDSLDDVVTELGGEGTADEVRTALAGYVLPDNVEILTYTGPSTTQATAVRGNAGNNTITGGAGSDAFNLSDGGSDTVNGGNGNDSFAFGATFEATDRVTGGDGTNDQIGLRGNYTGANALTINAAMLTGVELLAVLPGFDYALTTTDDLVGLGVQFRVYAGTLGAGDDFSFNGSAETDGRFYIIGGGGIDTIVGGAGNDAVFFGPGNFNALTDTVDGGLGSNDQVGLDGQYVVTLTSAISNVELIALLPGVVGDLGTYNITLADSFTPGTLTRTIFGTQVQTALTINGSAESDGNLRILGGTGNDTLTGGAGADYFFGNLGTDTMTGGLGADVFQFETAAQSTGVARDTIVGFASEDRIQLAASVAAVDAAITTGTLSSGSFDANLSAAVNAATLGANNAVLFTASDGDLSGRTFLVIDSNGTAGYQAGLDIVIELQTPPASISVANFIV